jgi:hypothetical protein
MVDIRVILLGEMLVALRATSCYYISQDLQIIS